MGVLEIAKAAAAGMDEANARCAALVKAAAENRAQAPAARAVFSPAQLMKLAAKAREAGLVSENLPVEKVAATIEADPASFIEHILQAQMPPDSLGEALDKEASKFSGENILIDHDGWSDCIRLGSDDR